MKNLTKFAGWTRRERLRHKPLSARAVSGRKLCRHTGEPVLSQEGLYFELTLIKMGSERDLSEMAKTIFWPNCHLALLICNKGNGREMQNKSRGPTFGDFLTIRKWGTEAAQILEKEYRNGIFVAVCPANVSDVLNEPSAPWAALTVVRGTPISANPTFNVITTKVNNKHTRVVILRLNSKRLATNQNSEKFLFH